MRVFGLQQRAILVAPRAQPQIVRIRAQINHDAAVLQRRAVFRPKHGAAAGCQHDVVALRELLEMTLASRVAKAGFALELEDHRNARARARFDFMVRIEERAIADGAQWPGPRWSFLPP